MRLLAVATLALLVAGCTSTPPPADPSGPSSPSLPANTWVHTLGGVAVDRAAFAGALPEFDLVPVTDRGSGEPTLGVTRQGTVFYAAIDFDVDTPANSVFTPLPSTRYLRSSDNGTTWTDASPAVAGTPTHPLSGDPYVYVDPTTGRIFAVDMGVGAECNTVSFSDDEGSTWTTRAAACPMPGVNDHPTLFAGPATQLTLTAFYPNAVYLCTNQVAETQCSQSPDGGLNWLPSVPVTLGYDLEHGAPQSPDGAVERICSAFTGHGHVSFVDGTLYLGKLQCGVPTVTVSRDGGLTFQTVVLSEDPVHAMPSLSEHDVMVSTDGNGTAYAVWIANRSTTVYLAVSADQGATWSTPRNVTAPGITAARFPNVVAGAAGRVAVLYVATTTPSGHGVDDTRNGKLVNEAEYQQATWNAYVGVTLDGAAASPVFATTTINDLRAPVKRGGCEDRCFSNEGEGGMYDFLDIDIDPRDGTLWAAIVDVCNADCDKPGAQASDEGDSAGAVGRQAGGVRLLVEPVPGR